MIHTVAINSLKEKKTSRNSLVKKRTIVLPPKRNRKGVRQNFANRQRQYGKKLKN